MSGYDMYGDFEKERIMTQEERRKYLIEALLREQPRHSEIDIPADEEGQKRLLRSLFNVRMPAAVEEGFLEIQDVYLCEEARRKGITDIEELGVGANTPMIIKYPFWRMTASNPKAVYACINMGEAFAPEEISDRSVCINGDIGEVLGILKQ